MPEKERNALAELADRLDEMAFFASRRIGREDENILYKAQRIVAELAKVNHGEASPTPWRAHTDREVRANDERLWIEDVVC